jgi:hypothetical protein
VYFVRAIGHTGRLRTGAEKSQLRYCHYHPVYDHPVLNFFQRTMGDICECVVDIGRLEQPTRGDSPAIKVVLKHSKL